MWFPGVHGPGRGGMALDGLVSYQMYALTLPLLISKNWLARKVF